MSAEQLKACCKCAMQCVLMHNDIHPCIHKSQLEQLPAIVVIHIQVKTQYQARAWFILSVSHKTSFLSFFKDTGKE